MATSSSSAPAVSESDFLADRQRFWIGFTHFTVIAASGVALLLILMAIFLL
jgi:hypothetical protein